MTSTFAIATLQPALSNKSVSLGSDVDLAHNWRLRKLFIAEVRRLRAIVERAAGDAAEKTIFQSQIDDLIAQITQLDVLVSRSPETLNKAGALCLYFIASEASLNDTISDTQANWGLDLAYSVLRSVQSHLTGEIGDDARKLLASPEDMPMDELDFVPA